jgi:hypothetical protein
VLGGTNPSLVNGGEARRDGGTDCAAGAPGCRWDGRDLENDGDPGWRTLSKGWSKLLALEEGYELARDLNEK